MAKVKPGEYPGNLGEETLADPRVRAMFVRPTNGFEWRTDVEPLQRVLGEGADQVGRREEWLMPKPGAWTAQAITASTRIHEALDTLAQDPTPDAVISFADRLGWLGHPIVVVPISAGRPDAPRLMTFGGGQHHAEGHSVWVAEARRFASLRRLWQAARQLEAPAERTTNTQAIREVAGHVEWGQDYFRYRVADTASSIGAWDEELREPADAMVLRQLPNNGWLVAARFVLSRAINAALDGHVRTALLPFRDSAMRQVPDCLLAAAYLRFATEVASGVRNPRGRVCGNRECSEIVNGPRNKQYHERSCGDREKYLRRLDRKAEASATKGS